MDNPQLVFSKLYINFLELDKLSLFIGRQYRIIVLFLFYYYLLSQNEENKIQQIRDKLAQILNDETESNLIEPIIKPEILILQNESQTGNFQNWMKEFLEALKIFEKFREKLSQEDKQKIAQNNLFDRLSYYNIQIPNEMDFSKTLAKNNIPRQILNEFHNAMSHLFTITAKNKDIKIAQNMQRAINHLKRRTLDFYKTIIKDYYIIKHDESFKQEVLKIREKEYQSIGDDRDFNTSDGIFKEYKNICENILTQV